MVPSSVNEPLDPQFCAEAMDACACFNFRKASRVVTQAFDEALQPSGLRSTQLVILLAASVNREASIAHLARELVMDASTLNRNLQPLVRKKLLSIDDGHDGRRRIVNLTAEGAAALRRAVPLWKEAQERIVNQIGVSQWSHLLDAMSRVVATTRGS